MKIFKVLFYLFYVMVAKYLPGKPDYDYDSAILGGIFFSTFLFLNIFAILIILGCDKIIATVFANLELVGFFILLPFPFIFIYLTCIHKKKYIKIRERYSYLEKNWKKRLLAALIVMLYMGISFILFGLSVYYLK